MLSPIKAALLAAATFVTTVPPAVYVVDSFRARPAAQGAGAAAPQSGPELNLASVQPPVRAGIGLVAPDPAGTSAINNRVNSGFEPVRVASIDADQPVNSTTVVRVRTTAIANPIPAVPPSILPAGADELASVRSVEMIDAAMLLARLESGAPAEPPAPAQARAVTDDQDQAPRKRRHRAGRSAAEPVQVASSSVMATAPAAKSPTELADLVAQEAARQGVPAKLAQAVATVESGYDPNKRGEDGKVGLLQVRYSTARALGYRGSAAALADPETNVKWGMKYLAGAYQRGGGDVCRFAMKVQGGHYVEQYRPSHAAYCAKLKAAGGAT